MADNNEFVLETKIELDDENARKTAEKFKKDYKEIKIKAEVQLGESSKKFDSLKNRITTIKNMFQEAFTIKPSTLSNIEKITADLTKLAQNLENLKSQIKEVKVAEESTRKSSGKSQTDLITKYKAVASEIDKLKNKMKSGMDGESFKNAKASIEELENELKQYESKLTEASKKKIELYNFKRDKKEISTLITNMNKIETKTKELQTKLSTLKIGFKTSEISKIDTELNTLKTKVNSKWSLNFDTGSDLNKLKTLENQLTRLEKIETLETQLKSFKETMKLAFNGDAEILDLESKIQSLTSEILKTDGSFEKTFNSIQTEINETITKANELVSEMKKTEALDQSKLISEYKQI